MQSPRVPLPFRFPYFGGLILSLVASSCATYYQQHVEFNKEFEQGDLKKALTTLQEKENLAYSKSQFLYFSNKGLLLSIMGKYDESNDYLEKAFLFGEDQKIQYFNEAAAYLTNPNMVLYRGEDHEHLMVLYYKALNFLKMNDSEKALVECRRLNIRLQQISDKYASAKKFKSDAFIHNLMGVIYQSTGDHNNAFIAYRNALQTYENDYGELFHVDVPMQLKKDLLDAAWRTGFTEEFEHYQQKFGMQTYFPKKQEAELVFFWHNGLSPVKAEWGVNFLIDHSQDNLVVFTNQGMGLSFPFRVSEKKERSDLRKLEVFRVAFPRYVERGVYFKSATLAVGDEIYQLQKAEDLNEIAQYSLQQRMMLEFSKGLLRAATKKATEHSVRKENETLGALIGVVNAMTEKADTRNWQTLPHSIYYARVPLKQGINSITFSLHGAPDAVEYQFTYQAEKAQTLFHTFSSLETTGTPYRAY